MHPEARIILYRLIDMHLSCKDAIDHCTVSVNFMIGVLSGSIDNKIDLDQDHQQVLKDEFELMVKELKQIKEDSDLNAI